MSRVNGGPLFSPFSGYLLYLIRNCIMDKKLDTEWFDLKNYSKLNDLDLLGWYNQISYRNMVFDQINGKIEVSQKNLKRNIDNIKNNPIIKDMDYEDLATFQIQNSSIYPCDTYSVFGTSAINLWRITRDNKLKDVWDYCDAWDCHDENDNFSFPDEDIELVNTPIDLLYLKRGLHCSNSVSLTINLKARDEQIINDFCLWLDKYRKLTKTKSIKKEFTKNNFNAWISLRVLEYMDLWLVAVYEQKEIKQVEIAILIFDDAGTDIFDKLRRSTKKTVKFLLLKETLQAMRAQLKI